MTKLAFLALLVGLLMASFELADARRGGGGFGRGFSSSRGGGSSFGGFGRGSSGGRGGSYSPPVYRPPSPPVYRPPPPYSPPINRGPVYRPPPPYSPPVNRGPPPPYYPSGGNQQPYYPSGGNQQPIIVKTGSGSGGVGSHLGAAAAGAAGGYLLGNSGNRETHTHHYYHGTGGVGTGGYNGGYNGAPPAGSVPQNNGVIGAPIQTTTEGPAMFWPAEQSLQRYDPLAKSTSTTTETPTSSTAPPSTTSAFYPASNTTKDPWDTNLPIFPIEIGELVPMPGYDNKKTTTDMPSRVRRSIQHPDFVAN